MYPADLPIGYPGYKNQLLLLRIAAMDAKLEDILARLLEIVEQKHKKNENFEGHGVTNPRLPMAKCYVKTQESQRRGSKEYEIPLGNMQELMEMPPGTPKIQVNIL